jgi:uncharacterized protein (TIGR03435 family)
MLQNLLAERFQLRLHHLTKEFSGYALVVAKSGSKLKDSAGPPTPSELEAAGAHAKDGFPMLRPEMNMGGAFIDGVVRNRFRDYPISELIQQLTQVLHAHVEDKTALPGKYDFHLEFVPPEGKSGILLGLSAALPHTLGLSVSFTKDTPDAGQLEAVSIISAAMEKQLGLKLEAAKIPLDVLVIDNIERTPTGN